MKLGEKMSLGKCLQMEYQSVYHFFHGSDFHEGVRALLIDKDRNSYIITFKILKLNPLYEKKIEISKVIQNGIQHVLKMCPLKKSYLISNLCQEVISYPCKYKAMKKIDNIININEYE